MTDREDDALKEYQRKRNNPYRLPHNLYMRVLYLIRDYDRLKSERQEILYASPVNDGMPRGNATSSTTESKAIRLARLDEDCKAVEQALIQVPTEYRRGVLNNICYGSQFPFDASYSTYKRWRQRLIFWTAENMNLM